MTQTTIPDLIARLINLNGGNAQKAAASIGTSTASLSRWRYGKARPRKQQEQRLRAMAESQMDLVALAEQPNADARLKNLEEAISGTIHALREEFHRTASVSSRQEVLDLVAALFFVHVTSIDSGGQGIGEGLLKKDQTSVEALNQFVTDTLREHLPARNGEGIRGGRLELDRFFVPLSRSDERFAAHLLRIFERDANAFRELHEAGRDDLINDVFSRFMSTSFVDEKEMGQYLTPPEITRFMVEVGFQSLTPEARERLLNPSDEHNAGIILDPSCGVGSFLAETIRFCHGVVRQRHDSLKAACWLSRFVERHVVGIDKSDRMLRLAMINLGLFGVKAANLRLANALARNGSEGEICAGINGRVELILTNPPFGATYKGDDLRGFAAGCNRARVESEILFLERYVDWLAPGGIIASVVPDSILVNRNAFAELRDWLQERCSVEAVISLPPVTFGAAGTNTKTSVLVLRKHGSILALRSTFFGEASEIGFDVVTRSGQRRRVRSSRTDLPVLLADYQGRNSSTIGRRQTLAKSAERWDAAFHIGLPQNIASVLDRPDAALVKVSDIAMLVDERLDPRRQDTREFDYVEISDVDIRTGLVGHKRLLAGDAPSRARKLIRAGDVLVSTVRPERGAVGLTPRRLDRAVCSTGFAVLRCFGIHPLALVWLLKTELVRRQMIRNNIGIAYPAISEASCLGLVLPVKREDIAALTVEVQALEAAQEKFEATQCYFLADIHSRDRAAIGNDQTLGEIPYFVDTGEPSAVSDAA
jgi:type I restriction-modification system DNA methylase subunit